MEPGQPCASNSVGAAGLSAFERSDATPIDTAHVSIHHKRREGAERALPGPEAQDGVMPRWLYRVVTSPHMQGNAESSESRVDGHQL